MKYLLPLCRVLYLYSFLFLQTHNNFQTMVFYGKDYGKLPYEEVPKLKKHEKPAVH